LELSYRENNKSSGDQQPVEESTSPALPGGRSPLLVNKCISEQKRKGSNPVKRLLAWPRALKLEREYNRKSDQPVGSERSEISSFSIASKRRLKFTAGNAFPELISQFAMTYHQATPDGLTVKKQLHAFLISLKRHFPEVRHLWILEFQTRQIPHLHLFLTLPHNTPGLHKFMAHKWHEISEPDSPEHLKFHMHRTNFIPWDMGTAGYLCKYLDKEHQKQVPAGFVGVGRFWGNSRGLVPDPLQVEMGDIDNAFSYESVDADTGEVQDFRASEYVTRQLCKHHEKSLRRSPWKSSARTRPTSYTLPNGMIIYRQLENYLARQPRPLDDLPF
jgi:hypothetical protein